jgi:hypothetical protein
MPKKARRRLARSEILIALAVQTEILAKQVQDQDPTTKPFGDWPSDDPFVVLTRKYRLSPDDLARELRTVGEQLENRALASGYDDIPDDPV